MTIMSICSACILRGFLLLLFKVGKQFLLITQASESNINTGSSTVSDLETVNFTQMVAATVKMWIPALLPPPPPPNFPGTKPLSQIPERKRTFGLSMDSAYDSFIHHVCDLSSSEGGQQMQVIHGIWML